MLFKKLGASLTSLVLAFSLFGLVGCSSTNEASEQSEEKQATENIESNPILVSNIGFAEEGQDVTFAFTAINPNPGYAATSVVFSIEGYDADGNMVLATSQNTSLMYPDFEYGFSGTGQAMGSAPVEKIQVTAPMDLVGWSQTNAEIDDPEGMFSTLNARSFRDENNNVKISGRVITEDVDTLAALEGVSADQAKVDVSVILVDSSGKFVAGATQKGLLLNEDEAIIQAVAENEDAPDGEELVQNTEAETEVFKAASFEMSIANAPGYKECKYYITPSA